MDCDAELAQMGITLPAPSDTSNIPSECMVNGVLVSPQECEVTLKNKLVNENIPGPCREAGITGPDECGKLMSNQRAESGLGMNIPQECIGLSPEECKKIMEEKGMEIQDPMIAEGEQISRECIEMGVGDKISCDVVMSKINGERMNNGEKLIVDREGNQDYITPDEVEQIIGETELNTEAQPNFESAEQYKQQVEYYENKIEKIEQEEMQKQAEIETGQVPETSEGGASSEGGPEQPGESGGPSAGESSGAGGGESAPTGEIIREINQDNFLTNFLKRIFG